LRRTSPISQFAVAAALEALGTDASKVTAGQHRLGIVLCVMSGCVNYSRRFYDEVLRDPATASPLVFPETVFNAPSSHLAALLGTTAINYTLVGDSGSFLLGVVVAADWLRQGLVDGCLVVAAEECDWLTADAFRLFTRQMTVSEGAGALYLRRREAADTVNLAAISDAWLFTDQAARAAALREAAVEASSFGVSGLLCDGLQGVSWLDAAEAKAWAGWLGGRRSVRRSFGEGLMASAAWQCVAAVDGVFAGLAPRATVSLAGINEHVMWGAFEKIGEASFILS
jgi:3-oxoacyl-(acyl-carrier-protein) synthase